jgi:hypothetical protein
VLPITQANAGWLLIIASAVAFGAGFAVRAVVRRRPDTALVRRTMDRFRRTELSQLLFGEPADDVITDEELDNMTMIPTLLVAVGLFLGGIFLVTADSFGVEFTFFTKP